VKAIEASTVFSSEWIQAVEKRYGNRPRSLKSWPYLIATDNSFSSVRRQIENWVSELPGAAKAKIVPNLLSGDNFWHSYHELVVGAFLKELGLEVEFERQIGEQTPDWFAYSKDGSKSLIVEVFTVNVSESAESENTKLDELTRRLGEIDLDFLIHISCGDDSAIRQLDPSRSKKIAEAVKTWLQAYNEFSEPALEIDGFVFTVYGRNCGFPTLQYASPVRLGYYSLPSLREKIEEKIHKYKNLILSNKIPLIVAIARGLETDYSNFEVKKILFGDVFAKSPTTDGLFTNELLLSGALFVSRTEMAGWKIDNYLNPKATFPLSPSYFSQNSYEIKN
jgi:Holliday junction resolvase-like predicted endonuclease